MLKGFRARLIAWNLLVITAALVAFSAAMIYTTQKSVSKSIDDDLLNRVRGFADRPGPGGRRGGDGPIGQGQGQGFPRIDQPLGRGQGQNGPAPTAPTNPGDPPPETPQGPMMIFKEGYGPPRDFNPVPYDNELQKLSLAGEIGYKTIRRDSRRIRVVSIPMRRREEGIVGVVQDIRDMEDFEAMWARQWQMFAVLLPFALAVAGGAGWFLAGRVLRPVQKVTEAAEKISDKDLSLRLEEKGEDELARLARTFNSMLDRLGSAFQSRDAANDSLQRALEEQKQFTADASHELRTPLTRIKLAAGSGQDESATKEEMREALVVTDQAANSMGRLVEQLLMLARADSGQLLVQNQPFDLRDVVPDALMLCGLELDSRIRIKIPTDRIMVQGDREAAKRILVNFLENAARHTPMSQRITVQVAADEEKARLNVADTGEGIPSEHLSKVMQRFYRVDAARSRADGGTGLGLAICQSLAHAMGGEIRITSEYTRGTQATLELRRA